VEAAPLRLPARHQRRPRWCRDLRVRSVWL